MLLLKLFQKFIYLGQSSKFSIKTQYNENQNKGGAMYFRGFLRSKISGITIIAYLTYNF